MEDPDIDYLIGTNYLTNSNKDLVKHIIERVVKIGVDFKTREKILTYKSFEDIYRMIDEPIPEIGKSIDEVINYVEDNVVPYSTNFSSPYSMAFPDAGNSIAALSGAVLSDFLNQNLINWFPCAPVGGVIEIVVLKWLRSLLPFPVPPLIKTPIDVGGIITSGGVASNTIAHLIAREYQNPSGMKKGYLFSNQRQVLIVPKGINHYSSRLSMGWLGIGENNVIQTPTIGYKYDLTALENIMSELAYEGQKILSVVAYAGDSRSMTCDNFSELRKLCDKYSTWLHVDGCHGTQLLFSEKLRSRIKGIELADSVTLDPHKVFNIPYVLSVLLVRNYNCLKLIQRPEDIITGEEHSFGQVTPLFGSRPFSSLKLYMLIKNLGKEGLGKIVDRRHNLAKYLARKIEIRSDLILLNPDVHINSVIFMYCSEDMKNSIRESEEHIGRINSINTNIQKSLLKRGIVWLHNFMLPDLSNVLITDTSIMLTPLRFMSGNPNISEKNIDEMLDIVVEEGERQAAEAI